MCSLQEQCQYFSLSGVRYLKEVRFYTGGRKENYFHMTLRIPLPVEPILYSHAYRAQAFAIQASTVLLILDQRL